MVKHNNQLPQAHFKKAWQERVKTWLDQPARKQRRRLNREKKAARVYPRPVSGLLRPVVRCPTSKYNTKVKLGKGFTLEEIRQAGLNPLEVRKIGISVDYRRKNASTGTLQANVQRLKLYHSKLVVFPRKAGKPKKGDTSDKEILESTTQIARQAPLHSVSRSDKSRAIKTEESKQSAYLTLRKERAKARRVGLAKKKAEQEEAKKLTQQKNSINNFNVH